MRAAGGRRPGLAGYPPRYTWRRRAWRLSCWTERRPATGPVPRRGSRTTRDSRRGSPVPSSPSGPCCKPGSSAPGSPCPAEAASAGLDDGRCTVRLAHGSSITAGLMVIATGARYRRPDLPRLEHFEQTSVYYAASRAEAVLCRGDPLAIVGGGNSAGQAAVFLSSYASHLTLISASGISRSICPVTLGTRLERIGLLQHPGRGRGARADRDKALEASRPGGRPQRRRGPAMFIFIGVALCTGWLSGVVALDQQGYVQTVHDAERSGRRRLAGGHVAAVDAGDPPAGPVWSWAMSAAARPSGSLLAVGRGVKCNPARVRADAAGIRREPSCR